MVLCRRPPENNPFYSSIDIMPELRLARRKSMTLVSDLVSDHSSLIGSFLLHFNSVILFRVYKCSQFCVDYHYWCSNIVLLNVCSCSMWFSAQRIYLISLKVLISYFSGRSNNYCASFVASQSIVIFSSLWTFNLAVSLWDFVLYFLLQRTSIRFFQLYTFICHYDRNTNISTAKNTQKSTQ